jgi:hypothetical protein
MNKSPFYIGQPHDHVIWVCKKTGRRRESLRILDKDGKVMEQGEVNLAADLTFQSTYPDVMLTFKRGRLADGTGALCYRIAEIDARLP